MYLRYLDIDNDEYHWYNDIDYSVIIMYNHNKRKLKNKHILNAMWSLDSLVCVVGEDGFEFDEEHTNEIIGIDII